MTNRSSSLLKTSGGGMLSAANEPFGLGLAAPAGASMGELASTEVPSAPAMTLLAVHERGKRVPPDAASCPMTPRLSLAEVE